MKKMFLPLFFSLLFLMGCMTTVPVKLDSTPLSTHQSTVLVYMDFWTIAEFDIYVDGQLQGKVASKKPLKFIVTPGEHEIHTDSFNIDRIKRHTFEAGKTHYMRVWFKQGMWVSSLMISEVPERDEYEIKVNPAQA